MTTLKFIKLGVVEGDVIDVAIEDARCWPLLCSLLHDFERDIANEMSRFDQIPDSLRDKKVDTCVIPVPINRATLDRVIAFTKRDACSLDRWIYIDREVWAATPDRWEKQMVQVLQEVDLVRLMAAADFLSYDRLLATTRFVLEPLFRNRTHELQEILNQAKLPMVHNNL